MFAIGKSDECGEGGVRMCVVRGWGRLRPKAQSVLLNQPRFKVTEKLPVLRGTDQECGTGHGCVP